MRLVDHGRWGAVAVVLVLAASPAVRAQDPATAGNPELIADLVVQMQQLQDEVRRMRGELESLGYEVDAMGERQRDQYLDLDQRINALREGGVSEPVSGAGPGAAGAAAAGAVAADAASEVVEPVAEVADASAAAEGPEVRAPIEADTDVTGLATPATESVALADTPEAEKAAYDNAFRALKELRYADAAEGFNDFLARYPDSEYADNAQYWLGESYYVTGNYEIALEAFEALLGDYPQSTKVPDALLKVGYTQYELENWDDARMALEAVQSEYQGSTVARLAESRLRSMRLEGR